jgi:oligopeptidase B
LLLRTEMNSGHFSVTGRFDRLKERALEYAFLLKAAPGGVGGGGVPQSNGGAAASS